MVENNFAKTLDKMRESWDYETAPHETEETDMEETDMELGGLYRISYGGPLYRIEHVNPLSE